MKMFAGAFAIVVILTAICAVPVYVAGWGGVALFLGAVAGALAAALIIGRAYRSRSAEEFELSFRFLQNFMITLGLVLTAFGVYLFLARAEFLSWPVGFLVRYLPYGLYPIMLVSYTAIVLYIIYARTKNG
jgi:hypothetical protein